MSRAHAQSDFSLEPLSTLVNQVDDRNGGIANGRRDSNDFVKIRLTRRVENGVPPQRVEAILFGAVQFGFQKNFLILQGDVRGTVRYPGGVSRHK